MPMMTWMADALRNAGLPVREVPGWQTRGHGQMGEILGVICHHTAGPASGDYPSEGVVVNGRPGLEGPLANLGLTRNGTWVVIAAGQAWHAGVGSISWCPANQGNAHCLGVEAESCGVRDDWSPQQRASYPRGVAALLSHFNLPASRAIGHKEWAAGRKIDPAFWDMASFRADVAHWMNTASGGGFLMALTDKEQQEILDGIRKLKPGMILPARSPNARVKLDDAFGMALNAQAEAADARAVIEALAKQLTNGPVAGPASLSDADVQRIAAAVLDELARRATA
jgi:hypothetical protein